jgi:DNA replication protein DnaC
MNAELRALQDALLARRAAEPSLSDTPPTLFVGHEPTVEEWAAIRKAREERSRAMFETWLRERDERIEAGLMDDSSPFSGVLDAVVLGAISAKPLRRWATTYDAQAGSLLLGATGVGKTAAAVFARRRLVRARCAAELGHVYQAPLLRAADIGAILREHPLGRGMPGPLRDAETADLLILDDLGWEQDRDRAAVADLIAARYDSRRPTVATSGLGQAALARRYGDAVVRRIIECEGRRGAIVEVE